MSSETGVQAGTPYARRQLFRLKHPYSKEVAAAAKRAYNRVVGRAVALLITGAGSPIPKKTGYLRAQTTIKLRPTGAAAGGGFSLVLWWPNVPYARYLIENAGVWQFAHPIDPSAVGDFPGPAMAMVWEMFSYALSEELTKVGIQHELS
jgi:hypothetical protein